VEEAPLLFSFPLAAEDTPLAGAKLVIERIAGELKCNACTTQVTLDQFSCVCPRCGSTDTDLVAGREILMSALEVEKDNV
jgi:hydrogenase nickel incorporation protein HypA/HybF